MDAATLRVGSVGRLCLSLAFWLSEDEAHLFNSPGHRRNWLDCIRTRDRCVAPAEPGARTPTIVHLENTAYWNERSLKWDPNNWRFVHDEETNDKSPDRERRDLGHCRRCERPR